MWGLSRWNRGADTVVTSMTTAKTDVWNSGAELDKTFTDITSQALNNI